MKSTNLLSRIVNDLLSQPTAPFRESWARRSCLAFCANQKIPVFEDNIGNLWVNCRSLTEARATRLLFVAHMDHPGMIVRRFERRGRAIFAHALWLGGGPKNLRGCPVRIFSDVNALTMLEGTVIRNSVGPRGPAEVVIRLQSNSGATAALRTADGLHNLGDLGLWGACLWYPKQGLRHGVKKRGKVWVTKAADDLAGIASLLAALRLSGAPKGVALLISRAEESGFHGSLHVLTKKWLDPKRTIMISVETSAFRPGATLGAGPVVRLGDKASVFDPAVTAWIQNTADAITKGGRRGDPRLPQFQRQVMDGGTCEATAFTYYGFRAGGLSIPLKNYHNQIPGSNRPGPEEVSINDVIGLVELMISLIRSAPRGAEKLGQIAFEHRRKLIEANFKKQRHFFRGL